MGILNKRQSDSDQSWDRKKVFIGLKPLLEEKGYPGIKAPWNAQNGRLSLETGEMDYVRFGHGEKVMVLIPGVGRSENRKRNGHSICLSLPGAGG